MLLSPFDFGDFRLFEPAQIWRSTSAKSAVKVLSGSEFSQVRIVEYYEHLALNCGRDFKNIRRIAKFMPLFYDGAPHKKLRKQLAVFLRDVSDVSDVLQVFEREAGALIAQKMREVGPLDVVSEIGQPIVQKFSLSMTGLDHVDGPSSLIVGSLSLKTTREIDAGFGRLFAQSAERFPDEDVDMQALRVVFSILGPGPLGASIVRSFQLLMAGAVKQPISSLNWPDSFPATGLEMAMRECRHQLLDQDGKSTRTRLVQVDLTRFLKDKSANPNYMFGVGSHACLGRGLSLSLWKRIAVDMRQNPMRVTYVNSKPSVDKLVNFPVSFQIEVLK